MEANKFAFQATPHKCNNPRDKGWYDWCDGRGSCFQKAHESGYYGPGKEIDTNLPFTVKMTFGWDDNFTTQLIQYGKVLTLDKADCSGYYSQVAKDLEEGMVFALSMWGSDYETLSWLDGSTGCQGSCDNEPSVYINDLKITTKGHNAAYDAKYAEEKHKLEMDEEKWQEELKGYEFGTACETLYDGDCE